MKTLYRDNKGLHRWLFACGAVLVLFYLFRGSRAAINFWVYSVTLPFEQFLGRACAALPFSVAELLYVLAAVTAVVLLVLIVRYLIKSRQKGRAAYRCALFVLDLFLTVCAAFSLLWGANYYADDFCDRSGLSPEPVTYEIWSASRSISRTISPRRRRTSRATKTASSPPTGRRFLTTPTRCMTACTTNFHSSTCRTRSPRAFSFRRS